MDSDQLAPTLDVSHIVHFVLHEGPNKGQCRPGIVVRVWTQESCNLQVFTDTDPTQRDNDQIGPALWMTSVLHNPSKTAQTWHHRQECTS